MGINPAASCGQLSSSMDDFQQMLKEVARMKLTNDKLENKAEQALCSCLQKGRPLLFDHTPCTDEF
jgi:hypothetical protein